MNIPNFFGELTSQLEKSKASSATSTTLDKHSFQCFQQKELYFWKPSSLRKHSFKNYSSGKKETIFLGGHPHLKKHSFQNYSSGKKGTIFLGGPSNLKEGNYIFGSVLNVQKSNFKNYSSKKREKHFRKAPKHAKAQPPKIVVPNKGTCFWSGRGGKPAKARL